MATLIKADGTITTVKPKNGKEFSLQELNEFVGGYIEIVRIWPGTYGLVKVKPGEFMICNEDGLRLGLPLNRTATLMYNNQRATHDPVVGNVLIANNIEVP